MERTGISRRSTLTGAASLGAALPMLAACGDDEPEKATDPGRPVERTTAETPDEPDAEKPTRDESPEGGGGGGGIASTTEVPVGGGVVIAAQKLVITQPTRGEFHGFTAVCTHQGCTVNQVTDTINCPCHGSRFSIETGEPVAGPATAALAAKKLSVQGDAIDLA